MCAELVADYKSGVSINALTLKYKMNRYSVLKVLDKEYYINKISKLKKFKLKDFLRDLESNMTQEELRIRYKIDIEIIRFLIRTNDPLRTRKRIIKKSAEKITSKTKILESIKYADSLGISTSKGYCEFRKDLSFSERRKVASIVSILAAFRTWSNARKEAGLPFCHGRPIVAVSSAELKNIKARYVKYCKENNINTTTLNFLGWCNVKNAGISSKTFEYELRIHYGTEMTLGKFLLNDS